MGRYCRCYCQALDQGNTRWQAGRVHAMVQRYVRQDCRRMALRLRSSIASSSQGAVILSVSAHRPSSTRAKRFARSKTSDSPQCFPDLHSMRHAILIKPARNADRRQTVLVREDGIVGRKRLSVGSGAFYRGNCRRVKNVYTRCTPARNKMIAAHAPIRIREIIVRLLADPTCDRESLDLITFSFGT